VSDNPFRDREPLTAADALEILETAEIDVLGRMPYSSNATFLVDLRVGDDVPAQAIYKPEQGERPLWDFPDQLYKREVAAFLLSEQLGWGHVPPTVAVEGPLGIGSLQLFVPADFEEHYFTLLDDRHHHQAFKEVCAFDLVANNTDRKGGHLLLGTDGEIHAIDNGLSFHSEFKVRTVIWDFAGEQLPEHVRQALADFVDAGIVPELAALLDPFERDALTARARALMVEGCFPHDPTGRRYPWPMV
jgi:uncharacterized repeat protein (TIGR03843 family)